MPKSYIVDEDYHEIRLDRWFKQKVINLPHSLIEKIIRKNKIKLNKKRVKSSHRLQTGDLIEVFDISKFKSINNDKKIKYIPQKKELSKFVFPFIGNNSLGITLVKGSILVPNPAKGIIACFIIRFL